MPYQLTTGQKSVLADISKDLSSGIQMNRLYKGMCVGKTEIAIITMLAAIQVNKKALFLAPTEILAEQHYIKCQTLLRFWGIIRLPGGQSASLRRGISTIR